VALWGAWEAAKAKHAEARSDGRKATESARASLKDVMVRDLTKGSAADVKKKLHDIEVCWGDFEEAKESERSGNVDAKAAVKRAFEQLNDAVSTTNQMGLDFQAETDAEDDAADEADDDGDEPWDDDIANESREPVDL
jgi:hypothetical protein